MFRDQETVNDIPAKLRAKSWSPRNDRPPGDSSRDDLDLPYAFAGQIWFCGFVSLNCERAV